MDPFGTSYTYYRPDKEPRDHDMVLLTHGEYVPVCYGIAGELEKEGHNIAVLDYNSINPIDRDAIKNIFEESDGHISKFMVVSQEREGGFGEIIHKQATEDLIRLDQDSVPYFHSKERCQWLAEPFILPNPEDIYAEAKKLAEF